MVALPVVDQAGNVGGTETGSVAEPPGTEAPIHAAMRADELLDQGDLDGAAVWRRIKAAPRSPP